MIYRLQRKFILISTVSVVAVIFLVFALIASFNISSMNRNLDILADRVSEGGGKFPDRFHENPPPEMEGQTDDNFDFITSETPFATRHFTVWFDTSGVITKINTEYIHSVTEQSAATLAEQVIDNGAARGWVSNYRYKISSSEEGRTVVFIDGSMHRASLVQSITICALVLIGCAALVLLLIILLSKRVVKPIAESYEKQRQFITDANHELKTPLTLILANLDIAEGELGKNEWLDDIRSEGYRMTELVNQLVELSRMDEESRVMSCSEFSLGEMTADTVGDFKGLAENQGKSLIADIDNDITYKGDEALLHRLLSLLLDNAIKYCDDGGDIVVRLEKRRSVVLTVENSYAAVNETELDRLFDRFYRADKARQFTGGYGIGLSTAKSIVERHKGDIIAYKKDEAHIGFRVVLKN